MARPNILLIMTDEERYAPPYEVASVKAFRSSQLTARESIRSRGASSSTGITPDPRPARPAGRLSSPGSIHRFMG